MIGDNNASIFEGFDGDDVLISGPGADDLRGGQGNDRPAGRIGVLHSIRGAGPGECGAMEIGRPCGGDDRAEMTDEQIGQTQASVAAASQRFIAHEVCAPVGLRSFSRSRPEERR